MPELSALLKFLSEATGWAAFGALALVGLISFITERVVSGKAHAKALAREEAANRRVEALTEAVKDLTEEVRWDTRDRVAARRMAERNSE